MSQFRFSLQSKDPKHHDAHPIVPIAIDSPKINYDLTMLTPAQRQYEKNRAKAKRVRLRKSREQEAEEALKPAPLKEHRHYLPKYAGITPNDFDGPFKGCYQCDAPLWGTSYVCPLWQRCITSPFRNVVTCLGCQRLFEKCRSLEERNDVIRWILTGVAKNLIGDIAYRDLSTQTAAKYMIGRALKQRKHLILYDHPTWQFLKSEQEIMTEQLIRNKNLNKDALNRLVQRVLDTTVEGEKPAMIIVDDDMEIANARELKKLLDIYEGRDAYLGHKCCISKRTDFNSSSNDHIEPCSNVRFKDGSYSLGNLQLLSRCLNSVKGNYNEKQMALWLSNFVRHHTEKLGSM